MIPDFHGDWISEQPTVEARSSSARLAVRIQLHEGVKRSDALRLLRKVVLSLEEGHTADVPLAASFGCCNERVETA
jgi:hypothetical protein